MNNKQKQLMFNYVNNIDGVKKRYPKDPKLVALFMTADEESDLHYFIYAACTKRDFSNPDLIEVSKQDYDEVKKYFKDRGSDELAENLLNNEEEIYSLMLMISDVVERDNKTIGEMLKLN